MMPSCLQCGITFEITDEDLRFLEEVSPVLAGKRYLIPPAQTCYHCDLQQRMAFRNERKLYQRTCDLTGKSILSSISPDKPYRVYEQAEWWSDRWDALEYGRDFDFTKTFTEQFDELLRVVPHASLNSRNSENSLYTNFTLNHKNCYLIFGGGNNEDCLYGKYVVSSKDCMDVLAVYNCELCYEGVASDFCYHCRYFTNSRQCSDSLMIEDCQSCRNCIGCFGLSMKEYCVFNQDVGKEAYEEYRKQFDVLTPEKVTYLRSQLEKLKTELPHRAAHIYASEDCVGDHIFNSKNCFTCFDIKDCEDSKYLNFCPKNRFCQRIIYSAPDGVEHCYDLISVVGLQKSAFSYLVWYGGNVLYSVACQSARDIFGCVGLKNQQYCILNKKYPKKDYDSLVERIIEHMRKTGEWGKFLDYQLSLFGYNETVAQEYFPLREEEVLALGSKWQQEKIETLPGTAAKEMPEDLTTVDESVLNRVFTCELTGRPYKVVAAELDLARRMKVSLPRRHSDQRHMDRVSLHTPYRMLERACSKCGKALLTTLSEERGKVVLCEECFAKMA